MSSPQLTVSYGLLPPHYKDNQVTHILPITKILPFTTGDRYEYYLTCSRDGCVIKHRYTAERNACSAEHDCKRIQAHSDWVSDAIVIGENKFITVSHDFSIVLHILDPAKDTWETKIIGDHEDYVKCIVHVPADLNFSNEEEDDGNGQDEEDDEKPFIFATGGLDSKIKIWALRSNNEATLLQIYDNSQPNDTGSIYSMAAVPGSLVGRIPYDLIIGDNNGNILLYSCAKQQVFHILKSVHKTNIRIVKTFADSTTLLSTSADGNITLWELYTENFIPQLSTHYSWPCPIWSIHGNSLNQSYIGDSDGIIRKAQFSKDGIRTETVYRINHLQEEHLFTYSKYGHKGKAGAIASLAVVCDETLLFSTSDNSNLNSLSLQSKSLNITKGGLALTRSSLLTNRRHVITENTKGQIQIWDIISCKLLQTCDISEGTFEEVVTKYTSKEILSHWCTVFIKVGLLFVKLNSRFINTEVYGSALQDYKIINNVDINPDERYNLGKIMVDSLFNEFIKYEAEKDKLFRKSLVSKKKDSFFMQRESSATPNGSQEHLHVISDIKGKEKKKKPHFMKFGLGSPPSTSGNDTEALNISGTVYPSDNAMNPAVQGTDEKQVNSERKDSTESVNDELTHPSNIRTSSSGSLLNRKLKFLASSSSKHSEPHKGSIDVDDALNGKTLGQSNIQLPSASPTTLTAAKHDGEKHDTTVISKDNGNKIESLLEQQQLPIIAPKSEFMLDLLEEMHESYRQQYSATSSSFKLLTRRLPESKITQDTNSPLIKIRFGAFVVVQLWDVNSAGGRTLFSTFLPSSKTQHEEKEPSSGDEEEGEDAEELDSDTEELLCKYDSVDDSYNYGMNKRYIFEQLEKNLPYWFAAALLNKTLVTKQQPKLPFAISVWQESDNGSEKKKDETTSSESLPASKFHRRLKFGRSKSSEQVLSATDLPKVLDANTRLVAQGMIKVKKIKAYIVDRFESKTPEMKAKVDPSEWLELLCKDQVLDNDMTLGTIKTLYWKSQTEIQLQFRRKVAVPCVVASDSEGPA